MRTKQAEKLTDQVRRIVKTAVRLATKFGSPRASAKRHLPGWSVASGSYHPRPSIRWANTWGCESWPASPAKKRQVIMASISKEPNGRRTIQFVGPDGKRRSIRLGKVSQKTAEAVQGEGGTPGGGAQTTAPPWTMKQPAWVTELKPVMYDGWQRSGWSKAREPAPVATVGGFLVEYVARRVDVKPATKEVW